MRIYLVVAVLGLVPGVWGATGWVGFVDQTGVRLVADGGVGAVDPDQKAYAWGDLDRDGDVDLVCVRKQAAGPHDGRRNVLLMNEGRPEGHALDGIFVDRTAEYASQSSGDGLGMFDPTIDRDVVVIDVDNDGWLDVVTATCCGDDDPPYLAMPRVYRNLGRVRDRWAGLIFDPAAIPLTLGADGLFAAPRYARVVGGDVNGDGFVDLFFANDDGPTVLRTNLGNRLLINDGRGSFVDQTGQWLPPSFQDADSVVGAALVDMDGDDQVDLLISDTSGERSGIWMLTGRAARAFGEPAALPAGRSIEFCIGDLNQDGLPDVVGGSDGLDFHLRHLGDAGFVRGSLLSEDQPDAGFAGGVRVADLNRDGFADALIADVDPQVPDCSGRLRVYRNLGFRQTIQLQEQGAPLPWMPGGVHDVAPVDIDNDGWLDLVIGTCRGTQVWMNQGSAVQKVEYVDGLPALIAPGEAHAFRVRPVLAQGGLITSTAATLYLSLDGSAFLPLPTRALGGGVWQASLPPAPCGTRLRWYLKFDVSDGGVLIDPPAAPDSAYHTTTALGLREQVVDDLEVASPWTVRSESIASGHWERVIPIGTRNGNAACAPSADATRGDDGRAFVTQNGIPNAAAHLSDVDGGPTMLISPAISLRGSDAVISWRQWFYCDSPVDSLNADQLLIDVTNDGGQSWVRVDAVRPTGGAWEQNWFRVGQYVSPTHRVQVRFSVADNPSNSITEAGIDAFRVFSLICGDEPLGILGSVPVDGAIDARQPSEPDGSGADGWRQIELVVDGDASLVDADELAITHDPPGFSPVIVGVEAIAADRLRIALAAAPSPGRWLMIRHVPSGDSVRLGVLPGDVNGDGVSSPLDLIALVDQLNGVGSPRPMSSVDIDRNGTLHARDILRLIDLFNGAGEFEAWNGRRLP